MLKRHTYKTAKAMKRLPLNFFWVKIVKCFTMFPVVFVFFTEWKWLVTPGVNRDPPLKNRCKNIKKLFTQGGKMREKTVERAVKRKMQEAKIKKSAWKKCLLMGWIAGMFATLCVPKRAEAIPPFARKYATACTTCHIAPPTLNSTGLAFRMNGYRFPNEEEMVKDEPINLGSESDKETYPDTVYPSTIPHMPPIAIRYFGDFDLRGKSSPVRTTFDTPSFFRLLSGGSLDRNISFLATICWKIGLTPATGRFGTFIPFQVQVGFHHLLEKTLGENGLNLRVGMIDVPNLSWNNFFQHLITTNYLYGQNIGENQMSFLNASGAQPGIELNGQAAKHRLWYATGVVNGGMGQVQDNNNHKDFYVTTRYKFGGNPYGGSEAFAGLGGGYTVELGGVYYSGKARLMSAPIDEDFKRKGLDLKVAYNMDGIVKSGSWSLTAATLRGDDDNPFNTGKSADYKSTYVEGVYVIKRPYLVGLRWEKQSMDTSDATAANIDAERWVANYTWRIRHNLKLSSEAIVYQKFGGTTSKAGDNNQFALRLDIAY